MLFTTDPIFYVSLYGQKLQYCSTTKLFNDIQLEDHYCILSFPLKNLPMLLGSYMVHYYHLSTISYFCSY